MADLYQQYGIPGAKPATGGRDLYADFGLVGGEQPSAGITGPLSALSNIGQGFNRALGGLASGADYALLGFLDDTPEGQAKRPLGYLAQLLKGEQAVPLTDDRRFAREPQTTGERYLQSAGETLGESVGPAGVVAGVGRMALQPAATATGRALQTIANATRTAPATSAAAEVSGALGSGLGEEAGRAATPDSAVGPIIGGLVGGIAPSAATFPLVRSAARRAIDTARSATSEKELVRRSREFVRGELGPHLETDAAQAGLARADEIARAAPGFEPSLAQRTGSPALARTQRVLEAGSSGSALEQVQARHAGNQAALQDFARRSAPEGSGTPDAAFEPLLRDRERAARQVRDLQRASEALPKATQLAAQERAALRELQDRTMGARADIAGRVQRVDRGQAGEAIREGIRAERQSRMNAINQLSNDFGLDDVPLDEAVVDFTSSVRRRLGGLLPSQRENMPDSLQDVFALNERATNALQAAAEVQASGANVTARPRGVRFRDIKALRESVNDTVLEATRDTSPGHRKRLANALQLRQQIDDELLNENLIDSEGYREYRRRYFEDIIEPFERGAVFKATRKDGTGFYRTLDEDVAKTFLDSADAADQIARIGRTQPGIMASLEAVVMDDLADAAVVDGVIRPRALERWLNRRAPALRNLPNAQRQVLEIAGSVADVERRFQQGQRMIRDRRALAGQQTVERRQQLQQSMQPLLQRMGTLNERKMALEDTMLTRRLTALQRGTQTPAAVISEAVRNPALMNKLNQQLAPYPDARKALQRHIWNDLTSLDGANLQTFLSENRSSLSQVFGKKHLHNLGLLADGLRMLDTVGPPTNAQPIKGDALSRIEAMTGLKPAQMASRYLGVTRGRSSRFVESFDTFARWLASRNAAGVDKLMREALYNATVAKELVESFSIPRSPAMTTGERIATRRLRGWLWNLGIAGPFEGMAGGDQEQTLPASVGGF